jgi:hypothetical protein
MRSRPLVEPASRKSTGRIRSPRAPALSLFDRFRPRREPPPAADLPPSNDLERAVQGAIDGSGSFEAFLSCLLGSRVFILIQGDPPANPDTTGMKPLVLPSSAGRPSACLFTSPERSLLVQRAHPAYRTGLLVEFRWVLQILPADLGIVLNPGSNLSLEQPPEGVARLKADLG